MKCVECVAAEPVGLDGLCEDCLAAHYGPPRPHLVVSRHRGAIEWLAREFCAEVIDGPDGPSHLLLPGGERVPIIGQATADQVRGRVVAGNLPLSLAAEASVVLAVEFARPPRGSEYSIEDMEAAGARLRAYEVRAR